MKLDSLKAQAGHILDLLAAKFTKSRSPRVTVVINTYNRADSLGRTLEALRSQTYPLFEVVVVNGPSTDNTDFVLERYARDIKVGVCREANLSHSQHRG